MIIVWWYNMWHILMGKPPNHPISSIYPWISLINQPYGGTPMNGNPHITHQSSITMDHPLSIGHPLINYYPMILQYVACYHCSIIAYQLWLPHQLLSNNDNSCYYYYFFYFFIVFINIIPLSTNIEYNIPRYSGLSPYHSPFWINYHC